MNAIAKLIIGTFCSRILGFLRDILFIALLGASLETSAFLLAFAIPNLFRRLCGEGALSAAFIPVFAQRYAKNPNTSAQFLSLFFTKIGTYLGLTIVAIGIILHMLQRGIHDAKWNAVFTLTTYMLPYLWFICIAALLNGALNVLNAFSITAFSPVLLNLSMLLGLSLNGFCDTPMQAVTLLSACVILGGALQWLLPRLQLHFKGYPLRWCWQQDADFTRIWQLFLPSTIGMAIYQINAIAGRFFAYTIDSSSTTFLYLASRFLELPLGLFAFSILSVFLPNLSKYIAQEQTDAIHRILSQATQLLLLLLIPSAIGLFFLAEPILNLFFCWHNFSHEDVQAIVPLLKILVIGLPLFGINALLSRIFYAHKEANIPVKIAAITFLVYVCSAYPLTHFFKIPGLALASLLSTTLQVGLQIHYIRTYYPKVQLNGQILKGFPWKIQLICAALLPIANHCIAWHQGKWHITLYLGIFIALFMAAYGLLLFLFNRKSLQLLVRMKIDA